jgi:DNA-binding response OmpR family regulator
MNILVVQDERAIADQIANILYESGHHVLPLYNSVDVLQHLGKIVFDLAFVTVSMPDLAGLRLGERLCDENNPVRNWMRVVLMGTRDTIEILKSQRTDFDFLKLPLKAEELLDKIHEIERRAADEFQAAKADLDFLFYFD